MKKIIYCIVDGKIGHIRQTEGLAQALHQLKPDVYEIQALPKFFLWHWIKSLGACAEKIQRNSIVIGAGHRTHFSLLYYKWRYRAKAIVIMKPSLPSSWFDFCIVPKHDGLPEHGNVIVTEGAMNALSLMTTKKEDQILILIGGPSSACQWRNDYIYQQLLDKIEGSQSELKIILSTSRRTPKDFISGMPQNILHRVEVMDFQEVDAQWLPEQLLKSREAWVTSDSVSMMYEALSAGCKVNVLDVPGLTGKIAKNLQHLIANNKVNQSDDVQSERLNESYRVAQQLVKLGIFNDGVDQT